MQPAATQQRGHPKTDFVGKCLGTAVTAVRPIIGICISMMSKEEGFYLQEMHV